MRNLTNCIIFIFLFSNIAIGQPSNGKKSFSAFAKEYVEEKLKEWQKKDEFEKTVDWQKRVTEESIKQKRADLSAETLDAYAENQHVILEFGDSFKEGTLSLGQYDADKEIFTINSKDFGILKVAVPIAEAKAFKSQINEYSEPTNIRYFINNDELDLAEATFLGMYKYENPLAVNRQKTKIMTKDGISQAQGSGSGSGSGSGRGISYDLSGRSSKSIPRPSSNFEDYGKVVVTIWVNRSGDVTRVESGARGTTTASTQLKQLAEVAALKAKFTSKPDAPEIQKGTITYIFQQD